MSLPTLDIRREPRPLRPSLIWDADLAASPRQRLRALLAAHEREQARRATPGFLRRLVRGIKETVASGKTLERLSR